VPWAGDKAGHEMVPEEGTTGGVWGTDMAPRKSPIVTVGERTHECKCEHIHGLDTVPLRKGIEEGEAFHGRDTEPRVGEGTCKPKKVVFC
jgi:hypothetical protein